MQIVALVLACAVYAAAVVSGNEQTGGQQSPIALSRCMAKKRLTTDLELVDWDKDWPATLVNTGTTARMTPNSSDGPKLRGQPLTAEYKLANVEFRWGDKDSDGSEHKFPGKSFAFEMQITFYNSIYSSAEDAMGKPDGLAVIAFPYYLQKEDEVVEDHKPVLEALSKIVEYNSKTDVPSMNCALRHIHEMKRFFSYYGSLTVQPHSPALMLVTKDPLPIHSKELPFVRGLKNEKGEYILKNRRELQPIQEGLIVTDYRK